MPARRPRSRRRSKRRPPPSGAAKPTLLQVATLRSRRPTGDAPGQALHRGHTGPETRRRAPPRRAHRAQRPRRTQGGQMELAAVRSRGPRLVPRHPLLHEVRQGGFLPRHIAASCSPGKSKDRSTRYLDIHEDDQLDEELVASWIRQASELPGWSRSPNKDLHKQSPVLGLTQETEGTEKTR